MARMFGTDGVRGEANLELTPELAYRLGRAAALYFNKDGQARPEILIGRDTRISGAMFISALAAGVCSAGGHAVIAGIIPTISCPTKSRTRSRQSCTGSRSRMIFTVRPVRRWAR